MNKSCSIALEGNTGLLVIEHTPASITLVTQDSSNRDSKKHETGRRFINFCPLCGDKSPNWYAYDLNLAVDKPTLVENKK